MSDDEMVRRYLALRAIALEWRALLESDEEVEPLLEAEEFLARYGRAALDAE